jgi:dTDP-4-amino-4,6-dideoxygalactose transaminase
MIPFNRPYLNGSELDHIKAVLSSDKYSGDGAATKAATQSLRELTGAKKVLLTTSCTHALEMAALLMDISPGDEVIMPSFTFVSTANPFVLRGARIVFIDIHPDSMNINESLIRAAITPRTRAIVPVHYAGVSCNMKLIMEIAKEHNLVVIEDAAQCIDAYDEKIHLGTIGHLGALSFHDTKNINCGEGGALLINDEKFFERAEIIREKGTNRSKFLRGEVDKYTWVDMGSSYLVSDLNAAFLLAQLESVKDVTARRMGLWNRYVERLKGRIEFTAETSTRHNAHIFFIKLADIDERQALMDHLRLKKIYTTFHYVPLHSAEAGIKSGRFHGEDRYTTKESERLLRLPLFYSLTVEQVDQVCDEILSFVK